MNRQITRMLSGTLSASLALFFISCADPSGTATANKIEDNIEDLCTEQSGDVLIPLAEGNYWRWEITYPWFQLTYPDTAIVRDTAYTEVARMISANVEGVELCFGEIVSELEEDGSSTSYRWNGEDGQYYLREEVSGDITVWAKYSPRYYPAEVGTVWTSGRNSVIEVVATDVEITTPAGTFICLVYYWRNNYRSSSHSFSWYAPGVGNIAHESYTVPYSIPDLEYPEYYDYATRNPAHMTRLMTLIDYQVE